MGVKLITRGVSAPLVVIFICFTASVFGITPIGDHICQRIEQYTVSVNTSISRPYVVKENEWCSKPPTFRCPKPKTVIRTEYVMQNFTKSRVVSECCNGYEQKEEKCEPICEKDCGAHGKCVAPTICKCHPGFHGSICDQGYTIVVTPTVRPKTSTTETTESASSFSDVVSSTSQSTISTNTDFEYSSSEFNVSNKPIDALDTSSTESPWTEFNRNKQFSSTTEEGMLLNKFNQTSVTNSDDKSTNDETSSAYANKSTTNTTPDTSIDTLFTNFFGNTNSSKYSDNVSDLEELQVSNDGSISESPEVFETTTEIPTASSDTTNDVSSGKSGGISAGTSNEPISSNANSTSSETFSGASSETISDTTPEPNNLSTIFSNNADSDGITTESTVNYTNAVSNSTQTDNNQSVILLTTISNKTSSTEKPQKRNHIQTNFFELSNKTSSLENNKFSMNMEIITILTAIIGGSIAIIILSLVVIVICQFRRKKSITPVQTVQTRCSTVDNKRIPDIMRSQLPPTPPESVTSLTDSFGSGNVLLLQQVQHVTMSATNNTFKADPRQATISPALREALEAHYDHPPSALYRNTSSIASSQRTPSMNALWDAVLNPKVAEQQEQEHLYDEIPSWNPRPYLRATSNDVLSTDC